MAIVEVLVLLGTVYQYYCLDRLSHLANESSTGTFDWRLHKAYFDACYKPPFDRTAVQLKNAS